MAVRQRFFNSTEPFYGLPKAESKGSYPICSSAQQETEEEQEEGKDTKKCNLPVPEWGVFHHFQKLYTQGTAKQVGESPIKTSTIIAQAECETQDSQEFSPSCVEHSFVPSPNCFTSSLSSEHNNVACPTTASVQDPSSFSVSHTQRKKTRRKQKSKGKEKPEQKEETRRQRHRTLSGVPEQESGSSVNLIQEGGRSDLSTSCSSSIDSLVKQDQGHPLSTRPICNPSSGCSPLNWHSPVSHPLPSFQSYEQDRSSDSNCSVGDCSLALAGLRGSVSQGDPCYAGPFFKDVERDVNESEDELSSDDSECNEGLIFYNDKIKPVDSEYKEKSEYSLLHFIKQGSYGEVYSAQDLNTGFKYAVKKIPLKRFTSEEVGTWSTLRSPRVVELFGVIRNGPYVLLLMDQKSGSLSQLIVQRGRLPEDLSLHYFSQVLTALEYLVKKKVVHLDIKADNVLLSEDGRDTFLCDFGHAEKLDNQGWSLSGSKDLKGTETHMAPEIVKGEPRGAKADVWSSCCMLLHMLNGCPPWTRYYNCRLYLMIAEKPPPIREIPPDCSPCTAEVLKAGLQKDPVKRSSATQLKEKADRALQTVGGLTSPVKGPHTEPLDVSKLPDSSQLINSSVDFKDKKDHLESAEKVITAGLKTQKLHCDPQTLISEPSQKWSNKITMMTELELRKLERDFYLSSLSQLHSAEEQEQLLSCINSEPMEKKDSGRWSLSPCDELSSGFNSYNSQPDMQASCLKYLGHSQFPPPLCYEGVSVFITDFNGIIILIRDKYRVKVSRIATGISDQITKRAFTLETLKGQQISHLMEVMCTGLQLICVPAPDVNPTWTWRVKDGRLETRDRSKQLLEINFTDLFKA